MSTYQIYPLSALRDNYIWVLSDGENAYAIDPGESVPVISFLETHHLNLAGILITHHHDDHTAGIDDLLARYDVPVVGSVRSPLQMLTHRVCEGDCFDAKGALPKLEVLEIPGHTLDHLAFYTPGVLFCGDTLFGAGCGRIFEGTGPMLYASLKKLAALPLDTQIYSAHEYTLLNLQFALHVEPDHLAVKKRLMSTKLMYEHGQPSLPSSLSLEKHTNPFLRCSQPLLKQAVENFAGKKLSTAEEVFIVLRKWKDDFK